MLNKEKVITAIQSLPQEFTIDDVVEALIVLQKIETGLKQSAAGEVFSTEEAKAKLRSKFPHLGI